MMTPAIDFFSAYRSYEEFLQFMDDLAAQYPFTQRITLGNTLQGRKIDGNFMLSSLTESL
jgi:hypothetical protein